MTDQPTDLPSHNHSTPADSAAVLERIDILKRGALEMRDALNAKIAKLRDPTSADAQAHAWMRERFTEYERDAQKRQLRSNIWALCLALFMSVTFLTGLLCGIGISVIAWHSTV